MALCLKEQNHNVIVIDDLSTGSKYNLIDDCKFYNLNLSNESSYKKFPKDIDIRGEVYIGKEDFEKIKDRFANPRNAASGSLRQKDSSETKKIPLRFIAYSFGFNSEINFKKQSEFLQLLKNWGFKTNKFNKVISGVDNLVQVHKELEKKRTI